MRKDYALIVPQLSDYYFHAGTRYGDTAGEVVWSYHTRRTQAAAEREARRLARRHGGRPIVEYWHRDHGYRPASQDAVIDAYYVDEDP